VPSADEAWDLVSTRGRSTAYVGDAPEQARERGFLASEINPSNLLARLDWDRSYKTPYEVSCTEEAERMAARGHKAARAAFQSGASELEIHHTYVEAVGCTDKELPYETIVCHDEKGAILHYVGKRTQRDGKVLLIDAGARHNGYASDITRTWTTPAADKVFSELVVGMDELQQRLVDQVRPGLPYLDLHLAAHLAIGDLLHRTGVIKLRGEDALAAGVTSPFFPHGSATSSACRCTTSPATRRPSRAAASSRRASTLPAHDAHDRGRPGLHRRARPVLHRDAAARPPQRPDRAALRLAPDRPPGPQRWHPHRGQRPRHRRRPPQPDAAADLVRPSGRLSWPFRGFPRECREWIAGGASFLRLCSRRPRP
jgi:hypothetical protein